MDNFNLEIEIEQILQKMDVIERLVEEIHEDLKLMRLKSTQTIYETRFQNLYEK